MHVFESSSDHQIVLYLITNYRVYVLYYIYIYIRAVKYIYIYDSAHGPPFQKFSRPARRPGLQPYKLHLITPSIDCPSIDYPSIDYPSIDYPSIDNPSIDNPSIDYPSIDYIISCFILLS